jgi:hypothetical protein
MFMVPVTSVSVQLCGPFGTNVEPASVGVIAKFGQFVPKFAPEICTLGVLVPATKVLRLIEEIVGDKSPII